MPSQEFRFKSSKIYAVFLSAILLASVVIIAVLPFNFWIRLALMLVLLMYGWKLIERFLLLRARQSVLAVIKQDDGKWLVMMPEGKFPAVLRGDSTVTSFVSVLRFDLADHSKVVPCIVFRDSLDKDFYRRLISLIRAS